MVALNKLLNVVIFALAVTSVIFAVKLHDQRNVILADRSKLMKTVETIASSTGHKVEGDFNTKATQESAIAAVEAIIAQKDALADTIVNVGKGVKIADSTLVAEELKGTDKEVMDSRAGAIVKAAQDIAARDAKINKRIVAWGEELGAPVNIDQLSSLEGCDKPLTEVQTAMFDMKSKSDIFVATLQEGMGKITNYDWSFAADELTLASEFKGALEKYKADMATISTQLASVRTLEGTIEEKDGEITELKDTVTSRNGDIQKLNSDIAVITEKNQKLEERLKEFTENVLDPTIIGEVIAVNKEFGFIVTDLGKKEVNLDNKMYIRRGENYVASVLVSAVDKETSVAEILPDMKEGEIQVGDKIIFQAGK